MGTCASIAHHIVVIYKSIKAFSKRALKPRIPAIHPNRSPWPVSRFKLRTMIVIYFLILLLGDIRGDTLPQNETEIEDVEIIDMIKIKKEMIENMSDRHETNLVPQPLKMEKCPYPPPDTIAPCECLADEEFRVHLKCNLHSDMDSDLMGRIAKAFGCKNEIFKFDIDLNLNKFSANFDADGFGKLKVTHFSMTNFTRTGSIFAGAIHQPLESFRIGSGSGSDQSSVGPRAFDNVNSLKTVILGNSYKVIGRHGFRNLEKLEKLEFSSSSLEKIESEAFTNLPTITHLDLSNQKLEKLPTSAIKSCKNLTSIDLSNNQIKEIENNSIQNVENLRSLDLSNNLLCEVNNLLENVMNEYVVIELGGNNIRYLLEDQFRPFVEARKNKGYINLGDNTLHCQCDMKWLLTSSLNWSGILFNGTCIDGKKMNKVNWRLLEKMCPTATNDCEDIQTNIGRPTEKQITEITSRGYPNEQYFSNEDVMKTDFSTGGTATLTFLTNTCHYEYDSYRSYSYRNRDLYIKVLSKSNQVLMSSTKWTTDMEPKTIAEKNFSVEIRYSGQRQHSCRFKYKVEYSKVPDYCF